MQMSQINEIEKLVLKTIATYITKQIIEKTDLILDTYWRQYTWQTFCMAQYQLSQINQPLTNYISEPRYNLFQI